MRSEVNILVDRVPKFIIKIGFSLCYLRTTTVLYIFIYSTRALRLVSLFLTVNTVLQH